MDHLKLTILKRALQGERGPNEITSILERWVKLSPFGGVHYEPLWWDDNDDEKEEKEAEGEETDDMMLRSPADAECHLGTTGAFQTLLQHTS